MINTCFYLITFSKPLCPQSLVFDSSFQISQNSFLRAKRWIRAAWFLNNSRIVKSVSIGRNEVKIKGSIVLKSVNFIVTKYLEIPYNVKKNLGIGSGGRCWSERSRVTRSSRVTRVTSTSQISRVKM